MKLLRSQEIKILGKLKLLITFCQQMPDPFFKLITILSQLSFVCSGLMMTGHGEWSHTNFSFLFMKMPSGRG